MNARRASHNPELLLLVGRIQIIENYAETRDGDCNRSERCTLDYDRLRNSRGRTASRTLS
jgi:hypothetical protein